MHKFILILLIALFLQGCSSSGYSIDSYRIIGTELKKGYNLSRSDLIISYDLARIDNTDCIYSEDLGFVINKRGYATKYIKKFGVNYKSPEILRKEAQKKIVKIYKLLLSLHRKYNILSNNKYKYIKRLSQTDLEVIDSRVELTKLDRIMSLIPLMLPEYRAWVSSIYGPRYHPLKKKKKFHCGIDLISNKSGPVFAAANGIVISIGKKNGYGRIVEIQHTNNIKTIYAHLRHILVKKGQKITRGKVLGEQGRSGSVTNEHLHFEIWIKNKHVDPYDFIGHACSCKRK